MKIEQAKEILNGRFPILGRALMSLDEQVIIDTAKEALAAEGTPYVEASEEAKFPIVSKTRNQRGMTYGGEETGMFAQLGRNDEGKRTIHLTGRYCGYADVDRTFAEGDIAVYDSYNFDYTGTITKISEKCVTIEEQHGKRTKRLDLATFAHRNYKFDLEKSTQQRMAWYD